MFSSKNQNWIHLLPCMFLLNFILPMINRQGCYAIAQDHQPAAGADVSKNHALLLFQCRLVLAMIVKNRFVLCLLVFIDIYLLCNSLYFCRFIILVSFQFSFFRLFVLLLYYFNHYGRLNEFFEMFYRN